MDVWQEGPVFVMEDFFSVSRSGRGQRVDRRTEFGPSVDRASTECGLSVDREWTESRLPGPVQDLGEIRARSTSLN